MENKPNREISELLNALQKNVEERQEIKPGDDKEPQQHESADELLELLKERIGAAESRQEKLRNPEYSIDGYELAEESHDSVPSETNVNDNPTVAEESRNRDDIDSEEKASNETDEHTPEEIEKMRERVESLVNDTLNVPENMDLPFRMERISKKREEIPGESGVIPDTTNPVVELAAGEETQDKSDIEHIPENTVPYETISPFADDEVDTEATESTEISEEVAASVPLQNNTVLIEEAVEPEEEIDDEISTDDTIAESQTSVNGNTELYDGVYMSDSDMRRFFHTQGTGNDAGTPDLFDPLDFDDTDINLALSLGSKDALENAIGYSRVRAARNGFYDPCVEESTGSRAYGYTGKEFRSYDQTDEIKKKYYTEKRNISFRFIGTLILLVFLLFWENMPYTSIRIPLLSPILEQPLYFYGIGTILFLLCAMLSWKRILKAIASFFTLQGDPFVPVSCLSVFCLIYDVLLLFCFRDAGLPVYNFTAALFLLFGVFDDSMRLAHECLSFQVVSDRKQKLSLERLEGSIQSENNNSFLQKQDFFVDKVNFVGNFFTRSGRRPLQYAEYLRELMITLLGALLVSLLSTYISGNVAFTVNTFIFVLLVCLPMQFLTLGIYPFYRLTKGLTKLDSAVIGEAVIDEYDDADTIYLDDVEMFGKHGVRIAGLRVYNDMDFYELLSYALSVFTALGAPLANVFDNSAREIEKRDDARITNITVGGIEAVVGSFKTVLVGNIAFMRSKGFFPKRNLDDEKKAESGKISILYIAIGGDLCAKLYMQYTVTQRFEKFAAEMLKNGIKVGIRTLDPNVNDKMIAGLRGDKDVSIKVIRPTPNELIPIGKHSDSGIVTSKNSHMIFKILEQCFHIKRIHMQQRNIRLIAILFGFALSIVMMSLQLYSHIPSLALALYQLIWMLPSLIYTKSNLK